MAIRLRRVDGTLIALCAARSVEKEGDIYLDDEAHRALSIKYDLDFSGERGIEPWMATEPHVPLMEQEESNNANRLEWDAWMKSMADVRKAEKNPEHAWRYFSEQGMERALFDALAYPWIKGVTIRVLYALSNANLRTRADIAAHPDLLRVRNIGSKGIALINQRLSPSS